MTLKNKQVGLTDISNDEIINVMNSMLNKFQKTFTSSAIVRSFEKVGISHRSEGKHNNRKSYFMIDTSKIESENHKQMGNVLKDLKCSHQNVSVGLKLEYFDGLFFIK